MNGQEYEGWYCGRAHTPQNALDIGRTNRRVLVGRNGWLNGFNGRQSSNVGDVPVDAFQPTQPETLDPRQTLAQGLFLAHLVA